MVQRKILELLIAAGLIIAANVLMILHGHNTTWLFRFVNIFTFLLGIAAHFKFSLLLTGVANSAFQWLENKKTTAYKESAWAFAIFILMIGFNVMFQIDEFHRQEQLLEKEGVLQEVIITETGAASGRRRLYYTLEANGDVYELHSDISKSKLTQKDLYKLRPSCKIIIKYHPSNPHHHRVVLQDTTIKPHSKSNKGD